jgi:hypothetical protein
MRSLNVYAVSAFVIALAVASATFQLYFRYQYMGHGGTLLRVDRLTSQTCRLNGNESVEPPCQ